LNDDLPVPVIDYRADRFPIRFVLILRIN